MFKLKNLFAKKNPLSSPQEPNASFDDGANAVALETLSSESTQAKSSQFQPTLVADEPPALSTIQAEKIESPAPKENLVSSVEWDSLYRNAHDGGANSILASHVLNKTIALLDDGNSKVNKMLEEVETVNTNTSDMMFVIGEINRLSKKSSMVALNLLIESSRLGNQGASIDVVAREMRGLAEEFKSLTGQIEQKFTSVASVTNNSRLTCKDVSKLFFSVSGELSQFHLLMSRIEELAKDQASKLQGIETKLTNSD